MLPVKLGPRRLAHFNVYVSNMARSAAFYHEVCGIHDIAGEPDVPIRFLTNGSSHHELGLVEIHEGERIGRDGFVQGVTKKGQRAGLNHLGWEMNTEHDLVEAYKRIKNTPLKFHTADHTIARSVYVEDMEGNMHEFFADTAYDWPRHLRGDVDRLTGQWDPEAVVPSHQPHHERGLPLEAVAGAPVRPLRISHGVLRVRDLQSMGEWCRDVAGLVEKFASKDEGVLVYCGTDSPMPFDLILIEGSEEDPLAKMSFLIPNVNEVEASIARIEAKGFSPVESFNEGGRRGFTLKDPDGLNVEFFAFTSEHRDQFSPTWV